MQMGVRPISHNLVSALMAAAVSTSFAVGAEPPDPGVITIVDKIGDNDNFAAGNAVDVPRRSVGLALAISRSQKAFGSAAVELDQGGTDRMVGFTHAFNLPAGGQIVGAKLTIRIRTAADPLVLNDTVTFDRGVADFALGGEGLPSTALRYLLGFDPAPNQTYTKTIDLSNVPVFTSPTGGNQPPNPEAFISLLPDLADGRLDVFVADDSAVDFSTLRVIVRKPGV